MTNANDTYDTTDFKEIIWLLYFQRTVVKTARIRERTVSFTFADLPACLNLSEELALRNSEESRDFINVLDAINLARSIIRKTP